jgi:hypothetical protein
MKKAEVLGIDGKEFIEMEMALKFTEQIVKEALEGFVGRYMKDPSRFDKAIKEFLESFLSGEVQNEKLQD